jgi:hypothetical protein
MKQIMGTKKEVARLKESFIGSVSSSINYDSFETMAVFYTAQIKKTEDLLNTLSIMDDTKLVIKLCSKVIAMKKKLKRGW